MGDGTAGYGYTGGRADETGEEETDREEVVNSCPEVTPGLSEWKGKSGCFVPEGTVRLVLQTGREEELLGAAENLKGAWKRPGPAKWKAGGGKPGTEDSLTKGGLSIWALRTVPLG